MKAETKERVRLSAKQKEVVKLMREGFVIHHSTGIRPTATLYKPHEPKSISFPTVFALQDRGLIEIQQDKSDWRCTVYALTELGKSTPLTLNDGEENKNNFEMIWSRGRTLVTTTTRNWTSQEVAQNDIHEKRFIFSNFRVDDEGRGRQLVCTLNGAHPDYEKNAELIESAPTMKKRIGELEKLIEEMSSFITV